MRIAFLMIAVLLSITACKNDQSKEESTLTVGSTKKSLEQNANTENPTKVDLKNCPIQGEVKGDNLKILPKNSQVLAIVADSTSYDSKFGESHRVLIVKDQTNCEEVFRELLPVNRSPDFPYYIADINYNNTNALVAIKGYDQVYCYDINAKQLQTALRPKFANQREAKDAQSGQIKHLELWEDYMIGYAKDFGVFVFSIDEHGNSQAVLPYVEYGIPGTEDYSSLFALESTDGKTQLLFPDYKDTTKHFSLNPLLAKPSKLVDAKSLISKDKRYALCWQQEANTPVAIDLKLKKKVELTDTQKKQNPTIIMKGLIQ